MRRAKLSPRKKPTQERSRATVDALVQATADILVRDGYAGLTTNRIAERAGVNIASLYQFFPGKEALVAEVRRRHVAEQREAMRRALLGLEGQGIEATVRALVTLGVAAHAVAPRLHHVLTEELPQRRSGAAKEDPLYVELRRLLESGAPGIPDLDLAMWMIDTASHAIIHRAAAERPDDLARPAFVEELVALLLGYLRRR